MTIPTMNECLRALVECIVPADDYPSGWQAGVGDFLQHIVERDLADRAVSITTGLGLLDAEARARHGNTPFAQLPEAARHALITDLLAGDSVQRWDPVPAEEFLRMMIGLTMQGYYGDPDNRGNRLSLLERRARGPRSQQRIVRVLEVVSPNTVTTVLLLLSGLLLAFGLDAGLYVMVVPVVAAFIGGLTSAWLFMTRIEEGPARQFGTQR